MKRRAPRRQPNGHSVPHSHPANSCRAIVPVDGTRIRRKIKAAYERALRDLDNARRQLDEFHQTCLPQFTRWLSAHFGALLTELRELEQKMAADEELIFRVQHEVLFSGGSHARAYQRVMERQTNPEPKPPPAADAGETDGEREPFFGREDSGSSDAQEDPLEALFRELLGECGPGESRRTRRGPQAGHLPGSAAEARPEGRLKELYRALARRLHPDTQREMTAQKAEWWHQAQAAYEAGDPGQLEVILTLCEIADSGTTAQTSASLLQRITAQLKNSLRTIKRQLSDRRNDPAWSFSRRTDHEALEAQIRRTLTGDLQGMRDQWRRNRGLIEGWKAAAERLKPQRPRRRPSPNMDCPF